MPTLRRTLLLVILLVSFVVRSAPAETIARCGEGWLERIDGYLVLHLKGTPEAMGYQHGALLKDHCRSNLDHIVKELGEKPIALAGPIKIFPRAVVDVIVRYQRQYTPERYFREMDALAAGAGLEPKDVYAGNFIPELFHCSGFAVMNSATADGTLYHGRVLDYAIDWKLQDHAVLLVAEPEGGNPFVNVTYAGFIGSVTGMNLQHVSVGEMGGRGLGKWYGMPMALLVREAIERADSLDEAIDVFRDNPRTCEYYYVLADGKTNRAVGIAATPDRLDLVAPGEKHQRLPRPVEDALLLSAGARYQKLVDRVKKQHGKIDARAALRLMDRPVAMKSNLHNVLFEPASTRLWVANATTDKRPAAEQKYHQFRLSELLARKPDAKAPQIPMPARLAAKQVSKEDVNSGTVTYRPAEDESAVGERFRLPEHEFKFKQRARRGGTGRVLWTDVTFPSPVETPHANNNTVHCEFFPTSQPGRRPGVIVLHILGGDFDLSRTCCRALAASGSHALFVKLPYYGPRRDPKSPARMISVNPEETVAGMTQAVLDIRRAAAWLSAQENVDSEQLGIAGISLGGIVSALAASSEPRLQKACLVLAGGDISQVAWNAAELREVRQGWDTMGYTVESLAEILEEIDPVTYAENLRGRQVLMLNAMHDEIIPRKCTESLWQACGKPEIVWWNAGHYTAAFCLPNGLWRMTQFFRLEDE